MLSGMRWMDAASCLAAERRLQADSSGSRSSTKPHAWAGWGMVLAKCKALHVYEDLIARGGF